MRLGRLKYLIVYRSQQTPNSEKARSLVKLSGTEASAVLPRDALRDAAIAIFAVPWEAAKRSHRNWAPFKARLWSIR